MIGFRLCLTDEQSDADPKPMPSWNERAAALQTFDNQEQAKADYEHARPTYQRLIGESEAE